MNQIDTMTREQISDKKALNEANIEIMELKQARNQQNKENRSIRNQLVEIRKELRLLVLFVVFYHS